MPRYTWSRGNEGGSRFAHADCRLQLTRPETLRQRPKDPKSECLDRYSCVGYSNLGCHIKMGVTIYTDLTLCQWVIVRLSTHVDREPIGEYCWNSDRRSGYHLGGERLERMSHGLGYSRVSTNSEKE